MLESDHPLVVSVDVTLARYRDAYPLVEMPVYIGVNPVEAICGSLRETLGAKAAGMS